MKENDICPFCEKEKVKKIGNEDDEYLICPNCDSTYNIEE